MDHASRFLCVLCMRACALVPCERAYPFLQGTTPPFWMPILPRKYCQKLRETRHMKTARPGQTPPMAARLPATPSSSVRVLVLWWRPPRSSFVYRGKRREDQSCSTLDTQTFRNTETSRCTGGRNAGPGRDYRPSAAEAQWHADRSSHSFSLLPLHHQACVSQQTPPPNVLHA